MKHGKRPPYRKIAEQELVKHFRDLDAAVRDELATSLVRQWLANDGHAGLVTRTHQHWFTVVATGTGYDAGFDRVEGNWATRLSRDCQVAEEDIPGVLHQLNVCQCVSCRTREGVTIRLRIEPKKRTVLCEKQADADEESCPPGQGPSRPNQEKEAALEIQTFLLAEKIVQVGPRRYAVQYAGLSALVCPAGVPFPFRITLPALILLRRESGSGNAPITLRLDLLDEDGRPAGFPQNLLGQGVFPAGERLLYLGIGIPFEFPRPGRYQVSVTADEGLTGGVFYYNVEVGWAGGG